MGLFYGQAVRAKYIGPSNTRGTRISVSAQVGRMTVAWDHALNRDENYARAIGLFVRRWGWWGAWSLGGAVDGSTVATRVLAYHNGADDYPGAVYRLAREAEGTIAIMPPATEADWLGDGAAALPWTAAGSSAE